MRRIATIVVMVLVLVLVPSTAIGQPYPIQGEPAEQNFGAQAPGETFNKQDCGLQPATTADIRLNDTAAGTKQVGPDGCVRLTVGIVDHDTVSIDGREYDARRCTNNTIFVTGPVAGGAEQRQVQNHLTISCAATPTETQPGAGSGGDLPRSGSDGGGALARAGSNIADLVALGGVLVVAGATVVTIVRRRRRAAGGNA